MSWPQIAELARDGHEIGGHTVNHVNLVTSKLTPEQKRREICDDRQRLIEQGFNPASFAYPEGSYNEAVGQLVKACGYRSARSAGTVSPDGPNYAERIPPRYPYGTWALDADGGSDAPIRLDYLKRAVSAAASHGGGWVQLVLHHVCERSDPDYEA